MTEMANDRPRFDGTGDAPMAVGSLCSECCRRGEQRNHSETNRRGQFFTSSTPTHDKKLQQLVVLATKRTIEDLYGTPEERRMRRKKRVGHPNQVEKGIFAEHAGHNRLREEQVVEVLAEPAMSSEPKCKHCWKPRAARGYHRGRGSHTFEIETNSASINIARAVEAVLRSGIVWLVATSIAVSPDDDEFKVSVRVRFR